MVCWKSSFYDGLLQSATVVKMIIWATIGPSIQIVAACLPTLGSLLQHRQSSTQLLDNSPHQIEGDYRSMCTSPTVRESQSCPSVEEQEKAMKTSVS